MAVDGIDVSSEQGAIAWGQVPGVLGIAKATEGTYYQDSRLHGNLDGMVQAGKRPGAYHFVRANTGWVAQADYFLSFMGATPPGTILALDLEPYTGEPWPLSPRDTVANVHSFMGQVESVTGIRGWLYTYPSFMQFLGNDQSLSRYPLWWAAPSGNTPPWAPALIQYGQGTVPGVGGAVDLNRLGPAYDSPITPGADEDEDVLYSTTDNNVTTYYRDAGGVLVPLGAEVAAAYYPAVVAGKITVIALGGVLAALAFNQQTHDSWSKLGMIGGGSGPAPAPPSKVTFQGTGTLTG